MTLKCFFARRVRQELKMMEHAGITISGGDQFLPRRESSRLRCGIGKPLNHHDLLFDSCVFFFMFILHLNHGMIIDNSSCSFFIMLLFCHLHLHHSPGSESSPFGLIHEVRVGENGKERIGPHIFGNGKHVPL